MGGFSTKIMASQISGFSGIPTQIISWSESNLLKAILNEKVGTFITASNKKIRLRKLWIAYGMASVANVFIDEGAANALQKNASLLSKGVIKFNNSFKIGDGLSIVFNKKVIAKGIAKIDSNTFEESSLVIHKDDLIIL
jgi:glutamate 5-kinase